LNAVRLLFWSAVAYGLLLALVRGLFPSESTPTITLTGIPLVVIVVMIVRDLAGSATSPADGKTIAMPISFRGDPVQFLSSQFRVAAGASNSYFENVVRARLKELLTTKVAMETGLESELVRRLLSDPRQCPRLLRDENLYRVIYGPTPEKGLERIRVIEMAVDLIGAWKG
jgi:hypothetical protein